MDILAIHFDSPYILKVIARKKGKEHQIRSLEALSALDLDVKPLYMKPFKGKVVSGLSAKDFLIRFFDLKIQSIRYAEQAALFQLEASFFLKPEEIHAISQMEQKEKGKVFATLYATPKEAMKEHLSKLHSLGLDPDQISLVPAALCRFASWKFPELSDAFIIDIGSKEMTCSFMQEKKLKKSHAIDEGIENLYQALFEDRKKTLLKKEIEGAAKQLDLLLLKPAFNPHLFEKLTFLRKELSRIYTSFCEKMGPPILFTGRLDAFLHLPEFLFDLPPNEFELTFEEKRFAVPIGLALEEGAKNSIQMRQKEFFPKRTLKQTAFTSLFLLSASIFLSSFLYFLGTEKMSLKKRGMIEKIPASFRKGGISEEEQIDQWIHFVETENQEYPYILDVPTATEVLHWLCSHPLLKRFKEENDPFDLKQFRYHLVSLPSNHSKDPFRVKVEIEFSLQNSAHTRAFRELLRKEDRIDSSLEIGWENAKDRYKASFFMKKRGPYVP